MVPSGWTIKKFGDVTRVANGQVDPRVEPYASLPHIGPENVVSDTGQIINVKTCRELNLISGKYEFDEQAIVYSKIRPNLNKVCKPGIKGVCSADMYPIWAGNKLDDNYLLHFMLSSQFVKRAVAVSMRTGMPKINRDDLYDLPITAPPISEQKKIAEILSTWDKAIETTEKLIANNQLQKKALMQQLLTGKKRFPEHSGEWKSYRLGQLFSERAETGITNLPLLSITREEGVISRDDVGRKDTSSEDKSKYLRIYPGDIGYNTMRMWQGVSALSDKEGVISPAYTIVTAKKRVSSTFMSYMFKHHRIIHDFYRYSQGLVSDTWNLKYRHFKEVKVTVPGFEEQEKISGVLKMADKQIQMLIQKRDRLLVEKKALMQQLLTGKRRVKLDATV